MKDSYSFHSLFLFLILTIGFSDSVNPPIITTISEIEACPISAITLNAEVLDSDCFGACSGAIDLTVSGAVGTVTYSWSHSTENTEDVYNLCAGNYSVTVTDALNTTATASFLISSPPPIQVSATSTTPTCGGDNGTISLSVFGGTPPYAYSWNGPNGPGCPPVQNQTDLPPGEFQVVVVDANGCFTTFSMTLDETPEMATSLIALDASCGDCNGAIDLVVVGGTTPYSYTWSNGETSEDISNLCPGVYELTVTDADGCTFLANAVEVFGTEEADLSYSFANPECDGDCNGEISVVMESGTAPYTFDWSLDDMDGQSDFENLCAGIYDLTVVDNLGCSVSTSIQLETPEAMVVSTNSEAACFGVCNGNIEVSITGGVPPFQYDLLTDLCPGVYQITVTDSIGCIALVDATVEELEIFEVTIDSIGNTEAGLSNGFIEMVNTGGTAPYNYEWTLDNVVVSNDQNPTGLNSGDYFLMITDVNGCVENFGPYTVSSLVSNIDFEKEIGLLVYPNPSNGFFKIEFNTVVEKEMDYILYDLVGNKVLTGFGNTLTEYLLDLENHSAGVYFLRINVGDSLVSKKITILK